MSLSYVIELGTGEKNHEMGLKKTLEFTLQLWPLEFPIPKWCVGATEGDGDAEFKISLSPVLVFKIRPTPFPQTPSLTPASTARGQLCH